MLHAGTNGETFCVHNMSSFAIALGKEEAEKIECSNIRGVLFSFTLFIEVIVRQIRTGIINLVITKIVTILQ